MAALLVTVHVAAAAAVFLAFAAHPSALFARRVAPAYVLHELVVRIKSVPAHPAGQEDPKFLQ
jgi:hypothetical protein